jgi:atlastin
MDNSPSPAHSPSPPASEDLDNEWDKVSVSDAPASIPPQQQQEGALQIVSIGTETNEYAFKFHEDALDSIMKKVPDDHKVCVVSVVGAFRTGKSFLLSWFLRYLNHNFSNEYQADGDDIDGTISDSKWHQQDDATLGNDGFSWRGGAERNTTGIWMWSQPFFLPKHKDNSNEKIALVLVDTQGMFDHETTMGLTAAIFGLSTLLSSYQIYNVDKRIQEDNLQQLALFSEYGRMALQSDKKDAGENEKNTHDHANADKDENGNGNDDDDDDEITSTNTKKQSLKPFQKIEFLVRDWQNFEDDENIPNCEAEMKTYLQTVLAERQASDLKDTREQILSCFDTVECYLLTHPGFAVTKKKYAGDASVVDPTFKAFMDRYCDRVFGNLIAKSIHGRELTSTELGAYIQNYAKMFESGAHFPEAATMLEATASANNSNATNLSIRKYKDQMDELAGARCSEYLNPSLLEQSHVDHYGECLEIFDGIATFGSPKGIEDARIEVIKSIQESYEMYSKLNDGRNPLLGFET